MWTPVSHHSRPSSCEEGGGVDHDVCAKDGGCSNLERYFPEFMKEDLRKERARRDRIIQVLSKFHLDNGYVVERVLADYNAVYGHRKPRRGFRKSEYKSRLATAFAVCRQLILLGAPRPPRHVAILCGLSDAGALLKVDKLLNMNRRETKMELHKMPDADPNDYVDLICCSLYLPRKLACLARELMAASRIRWLMYGRNPTHIASAVLFSLMCKMGELSTKGREAAREQLLTELSVNAGCKAECITHIAELMPRYELTIGHEVKRDSPGRKLFRPLQRFKITRDDEEGWKLVRNNNKYYYHDLLYSIGVWASGSKTKIKHSFRMLSSSSLDTEKALVKRKNKDEEEEEEKKKEKRERRIGRTRLPTVSGHQRRGPERKCRRSLAGSKRARASTACTSN